MYAFLGPPGQRGETVDERQLAAKCEGAIKISADMISRLMTALSEMKIQFCVAPFEADAQLAYLCRIGWVHAVISEDSDLRCPGDRKQLNPLLNVFPRDRFLTYLP